MATNHRNERYFYATNVDDTEQCPVCFEEYTETGDHVPLLLPCTHTLCKKCKEELIKNNRKTLMKNILICPLDNKRHPGNQNFPENRYIIGHMQKTTKLQKPTESDPSIAQDNEVTKEIFPLNTRPITCAKHKERFLSLHCLTCQSDICELCMIKCHVGHEITDIEDYLLLCHQQLKRRQDTVKEEITKAKVKLNQAKEEAADRMTKCMAELQETKIKVIQKTEETFQHMIDRVKEQQIDSERMIKESGETLNELLTEAWALEASTEVQSLDELSDRERKTQAFCEKWATTSKWKTYKFSTFDTCAAPDEVIQSLGFALREKTGELDMCLSEAEKLHFKSVHSIPTQYHLKYPFVALGVDNQAFVAGCTKGEEWLLSRFNLESGEETEVFKLDAEPNGLAAVQLGGQNCVALSFVDKHKIVFHNQSNMSHIIRVLFVVPHNPEGLCAASSTQLLLWDWQEDKEEIHWLDCSTNTLTYAASSNAIQTCPTFDASYVKFGGKELLVVTSGENGIMCYDATTGIQQWAVGTDERFDASGVTTDGRGQLFVCDVKNHCIQMFSISDGKYLGVAFLQENLKPWALRWSEGLQALVAVVVDQAHNLSLHVVRAGFWGTGGALRDRNAFDKTLSTNMLGKVLMQVRVQLRPK